MEQNYKGHNNISIEIQDFSKGLVSKADKIFNALNLISKYVSNKEVEDRFISLSIDFLEMSYTLHSRYTDNHNHLLSELNLLISEIKALTSGLVIRGVLNTDSKLIFDQELNNYLESMSFIKDKFNQEQEKTEGIISPLFDENFFGETLKPNLILENKKEIFEKESEDKDMSFIKKEDKYSKGHTASDDFSKGHQILKKKTDLVDRLNRKTSILNFIKQNKEVGIKDIVSYVGDCSIKTIQRELNDLIDDNVIKKSGDRRWSKYSLN
jgi:hypothetical protein